MKTPHYCLLVLLFLSSIFCLDSKIESDRKLNIAGDINHPLKKLEGKESPLCITHKPTSKIDYTTYVRCLEEGSVMTSITFADYGNPTGNCRTGFKHGKCGSPNTLWLVKKNCLGKKRCVLFVTDEMFGPSHCTSNVSLAVQGVCTST